MYRSRACWVLCDKFGGGENTYTLGAGQVYSLYGSGFTSTPSPTLTPTRTSTPVAGIWMPTAEAPFHWQWQLSDPLNISTDLMPAVTVYDIDWGHNSASTVAALHALGFKVVAHLEAGD